MIILARPEVEPKTPLGRRLRAIRARFHVEDRDVFADELGISKGSLAHYERGERVPDATVLAAYRQRFNINLSWLVTGEGDMFDGANDAPPLRTNFDVTLLQRLGDMVQAVYAECRQTPPARAITAEAGNLYNELVRTVQDVRDQDAVDAKVTELRRTFKERIENAEPGSGKRSAS